jgi:hypothetical protein
LRAPEALGELGLRYALGAPEARELADDAVEGAGLLVAAHEVGELTGEHLAQTRVEVDVVGVLLRSLVTVARSWHCHLQGGKPPARFYILDTEVSRYLVSR